MFSRSGEAPWNPASPTAISPEEFEKQVQSWLAATGTLRTAQVLHRATLSGPGGDYEIDILVELEVFGGAAIRILVECKRHARPVEREDVIVLHAKLPELKAHKAMLFSTAGFQKGALLYADAHGIATVAVVDGTSTYETKSLDSPSVPPPWVHLPRFAGIRMRPIENGVNCHLIDDEHLDAITDWFGQ